MAESKKPPAKRAPRKKPAAKANSNDEAAGQFASSDDVRTAFIPGSTFGARAVQYAVVDGDAVFEGDIDLGTADEVEAMSAQLAAEVRGDVALGVVITGAQFRWADCRIPYTIDPALPNQARVTDAIAHWEQNTNYTFVLRTAVNQAQFPDWVTFRPHATRCSSAVGRRGGQQFVNLQPLCSTRSVIHEIGHVVGLWHEQSREDRDAFVTINWSKIQAGREHNFNQHITDGDDVGAYDYASIMHYPRNAFSVDGSDTITPVDPAAVIGQATGLSPGDIATANTLCTPPKVTIETTKELAGETIKELIKERIGETVKEFAPETIKERWPETRKELMPETIKERWPETRKEFAEPTVVERTQPGVINPPVRPGVLGRLGGGDAMPFAMRTPQSQQGAADAALYQDPGEELAAQLDAVVAAMQAAQGDVEALAEQQEMLIAALQQLGWQ